jgi:hypothetical protein
MSIIKQESVDQITVTEKGVVLYRVATRLIEDGKQLSETFHRSSLTPGQDVSQLPANVRAICELVWTPEVVAEYQAATV